MRGGGEWGQGRRAKGLWKASFAAAWERKGVVSEGEGEGEEGEGGGGETGARERELKLWPAAREWVMGWEREWGLVAERGTGKEGSGRGEVLQAVWTWRRGLESEWGV